jgi:carboxyl-terminal processing protease
MTNSAIERARRTAGHILMLLAALVLIGSAGGHATPHVANFRQSAITRRSLAISLHPQRADSATAEAPKNIILKTIDEKYLYSTSKPAWKKVRAIISRAHVDDPVQLYLLIARQLAKLRDSELHLVTPAELDAINDESNGRTIGTGLIDFGIDIDPLSGLARIVTPTTGSPAAVAGLRSHDVVVTIDGKSTRLLDHEQVLDLLRQAEVELVLRRGHRSMRVRLTRSSAPMVPVTAELVPTSAGFVGYIHIVQFTPGVADEVRAFIEKFDAQHTRGYILDLRNNPGGFLDAAAKVAGLFASGTVGTKVHQSGPPEPIESVGPSLTEAPVVVLVNQGTASAAEFVAGALQDLKRAVLVGTPTYGRGQAQTFQSLAAGYGLIVPSARLLTPRGRSYKNRGLTPSVMVTMRSEPTAEFGSSEDLQFQRAVSLLLRLSGVERY